MLWSSWGLLDAFTLFTLINNFSFQAGLSEKRYRKPPRFRFEVYSQKSCGYVWSQNHGYLSNMPKHTNTTVGTAVSSIMFLI